MAKKIYKQTFKGRPSLAQVHEDVGRHGGLIVRVDQSDAGTTAYFEADETAQAAAKKDESIKEASLKEVTKT